MFRNSFQNVHVLKLIFHCNMKMTISNDLLIPNWPLFSLKLYCSHYKALMNWTGCQFLGFHLMYVQSGQMAFWCKRQHGSGSNFPPPSYIMHDQGRWGPRVNTLVRNCATVRLLAGHRVLHRSCLNFSTSKLLRCPPAHLPTVPRQLANQMLLKTVLIDFIFCTVQYSTWCRPQKAWHYVKVFYSDIQMS